MTKINITATYSASEQGTDADDKHDVEYRWTNDCSKSNIILSSHAAHMHMECSHRV